MPPLRCFSIVVCAPPHSPATPPPHPHHRYRQARPLNRHTVDPVRSGGVRSHKHSFRDGPDHGGSGCGGRGGGGCWSSASSGRCRRTRALAELVVSEDRGGCARFECPVLTARHDTPVPSQVCLLAEPVRSEFISDPTQRSRCSKEFSDIWKLHGQCVSRKTLGWCGAGYTALCGLLTCTCVQGPATSVRNGWWNLYRLDIVSTKTTSIRR